MKDWGTADSDMMDRFPNVREQRDAFEVAAFVVDWTKPLPKDCVLIKTDGRKAHG